MDIVAGNPCSLSISLKHEEGDAVYRFISSSNPDAPFKRRERVTIGFLQDGNVVRAIIRGELGHGWRTSRIQDFLLRQVTMDGHVLTLQTENSTYEFRSCNGQHVLVQLEDLG